MAAEQIDSSPEAAALLVLVPGNDFDLASRCEVAVSYTVQNVKITNEFGVPGYCDCTVGPLSYSVAIPARECIDVPFHENGGSIGNKGSKALQLNVQ